MALFSLILIGLISLHLVESSWPPLDSRPEPLSNRRNNETMESNKEAFLVSGVVQKGTRRALRECRRQFKDEIWNCSISKGQMEMEVPFVTREMAFVQAIGSAAIALEFTRKCKQIKIPERNAECKDMIEFGQEEARLFLDKPENGNEAHTAVKLHNNRVGREVIRELAASMARCMLLWYGNLSCWMNPEQVRFEAVGAKLKEKYYNATRVWFVNNTLQERVDHDQFKAISRDDSRLVYLNSSPDYCVRNDTLGSLGMLGRTCKSYDVQVTKCQAFIPKCNSCKLKYRTVEYEIEEYKCNCRFHWCCYVKCKTCKRTSYITTCTEHAIA